MRMVMLGKHPRNGATLPLLWESPVPLQTDMACTIMGLVSTAGLPYNGRACLLGDFHHTTGRWEAQVPEQGEVTMLLVKGFQLSALPTGANMAEDVRQRLLDITQEDPAQPYPAQLPSQPLVAEVEPQQPEDEYEDAGEDPFQHMEHCGREQAQIEDYDLDPFGHMAGSSSPIQSALSGTQLLLIQQNKQLAMQRRRQRMLQHGQADWLPEAGQCSICSDGPARLRSCLLCGLPACGWCWSTLHSVCLACRR